LEKVEHIKAREASLEEAAVAAGMEEHQELMDKLVVEALAIF
jgi:hypothetical protein